MLVSVIERTKYCNRIATLFAPQPFKTKFCIEDGLPVVSYAGEDNRN